MVCADLFFVICKHFLMMCQYAISLKEKRAVTLTIVEKMTIEKQNINCETKNKKHLQKINSKDGKLTT